jgi:hypothetical protein
MKKLTLDLDGIRVESFATAESAGARGTVHGHDDTIETEWCTMEKGCSKIGTCFGQNTCPWQC